MGSPSQALLENNSRKWAGQKTLGGVETQMLHLQLTSESGPLKWRLLDSGLCFCGGQGIHTGKHLGNVASRSLQPPGFLSLQESFLSHHPKWPGLGHAVSLQGLIPKDHRPNLAQDPRILTPGILHVPPGMLPLLGSNSLCFGLNLALTSWGDL